MASRVTPGVAGFAQGRPRRVRCLVGSQGARLDVGSVLSEIRECQRLRDQNRVYIEEMCKSLCPTTSQCLLLPPNVLCQFA